MSKKILFDLNKSVLAFVVIMLFIPYKVFAENIKIIALFPFNIHSKTNAIYLQDAVYKGLSEQLLKAKSIKLIDKDAILKAAGDRSIDEALALTVGKNTNADYSITGSLSEFGEQISVDVKVIDTLQGKVLPSIYMQGKGLESIGQISKQLVSNILIDIYADQKIARIEYKGNRKIEASAINQVMKSGIGKLLNDEDISADIKAIYKMGYFDDVAADVTDTPEGKVITFILQEKGLITEIKIKGNEDIDTKDIETVLSIKTRQILNQEKIKGDIEKIKALYDSKGYYNAEISHTIEKVGDKDVRVLFNINEFKKLFIKKISFEGNHSYNDKELRDIMSIKEWGIFHFFTESGLLKKDQLQQDIGRLNVFYANNGFINAHVGEPEISHDQKGIYIKIPITEGKRFSIGKVDITGDTLKISPSELLEKLILNKKEYYDRESVLKDIDFLTEACNDEGYAYADISPHLMPQEKDQKVDVIFKISKGNQVYFNKISISGNTKTRDKVIRRQLAIVEGDLYNKTNLKQSYLALNRLRYFEEVDFQTEKGPDETMTDVNIRVKERQTGLFSIGAGYSAMERAVLSAQISQQNLFGRGQMLSLKANIGTVSTNYELSFTEPWLFDIPLWSNYNIWNSTREYDEYNLTSKGFGVTFGYPVFEHFTGYIGYKLAMDDITYVADTASVYIQEQKGKTTSSMITVTLTRDTTDDWMFPSKGSKNSASVEYTGDILQGDTSFTRYGVSSAWFFSLPLDTVFGIRGRAGYIRGNEGKKVPIYERYYLGGINSLRGLRSIGPTDPSTGEVIGGLTMLNFNAEFLFPLIKDAGMKGVIFCDTGNSWEEDYHINDMRKTAGAGIRWFSPIGPLRLEWGYVLDKKSGESASRWEFTIGMFM